MVTTDSFRMPHNWECQKLLPTQKRKRPRLRLESRDARSNSPPPKTAQSEDSLACRQAEWLLRACGGHRWAKTPTAVP